jgi:hypothetical protein
VVKNSSIPAFLNSQKKRKKRKKDCPPIGKRPKIHQTPLKPTFNILDSRLSDIRRLTSFALPSTSNVIVFDPNNLSNLIFNPDLRVQISLIHHVLID